LAASNVNKKIDLKNAAEVFGLWDNVYGKDAIRSLENSMRWDPSKKEKDKKLAKKVKFVICLKMHTRGIGGGGGVSVAWRNPG
jgi:hypothetical protein